MVVVRACLARVCLSRSGPRRPPFRLCGSLNYHTLRAWDRKERLRRTLGSQPPSLGFALAPLPPSLPPFRSPPTSAPWFAHRCDLSTWAGHGGWNGMCGADLFGTLPGEASDVTAGPMHFSSHEGKSVGRTADIQSNLEAAALFGFAFHCSLHSNEVVISNRILGRRLNGSYFGQPCFV